MQIFHWFFKTADEQGVQKYTTRKDQEDKPEDTVPCKKKNRRSTSKKVEPFLFLCNKDISKVHSQDIMKMKKEGTIVVSQKSDSSRVSPLSEAQVAVSSSTIGHDRRRQCSSSYGKKDKWPKTMSRMKELLRWAAASAKSEKGGGNVSKKVDGRRLSISESPKISFRWDAMGFSAVSDIPMTCSARNAAAFDMVSLNSTVLHGLDSFSGRRGNWITTDSEYVVLEL